MLERITFFLLLGLAVPVQSALAQQRAVPRARLTVLADSVSVGERVRVAVAVDHAAGQSAVFPDVPVGSAEAAPLVSFGDAEAFAVRRLPPRARGAVRTDSAVYEVAVFALDRARVGPVVVRLAADRDTVSVPTGVAVVPVRTELGGATGDAADAEPAPIGSADPFPGLLPVWLALGATVALLAGLAVWLVRRRPRRAVPDAPRAAPFPEATAALDALAAPATPEAASAQALGAREALRVFLARRLGVPALETTTAELDAALARDARVPAAARDAARRVLDAADLVAFAGVAPSPASAAETVGTARAAVHEIEASVQSSEAPEIRTGSRRPGVSDDSRPAVLRP